MTEVKLQGLRRAAHAPAEHQQPDSRDVAWLCSRLAGRAEHVLAIAHNGNLSNGLMFPIVEARGRSPRLKEETPPGRKVRGTDDVVGRGEESAATRKKCD